MQNNLQNSITDISQKYQTEAQKQFDYIDLVTTAFEKKCQELKASAEQKIQSIESSDTEQTAKTIQINQIKLSLKKSLNQVLEEFEKEMKRSFQNNLYALETIYHQKELVDIQLLDQKLQTI